MNSHLNVFKTYTKKDREYQLENDLTRALAICLQEDSLFFHEVLKEVFLDLENCFSQLFEALESDTSISVEIQKRTDQIVNFEHIFAISLSESQMTDFWAQNYSKEYDPICDLVITINQNIVIVLEVKRDDVNCTAQLYNQILNITKSDDLKMDFNKQNYKNIVTPIDLNWEKLMSIAVKVSSFEKSMNSQNRFLSDFIKLIRNHNFKWLPEAPISVLQKTNSGEIKKRIEAAIEELDKKSIISKLNIPGRFGLYFAKDWANEINFDINENGSLIAHIYPGNTKRQGYSLFESNLHFKEKLTICNEVYEVNKLHHIKFSGQSYITEIDFIENNLKLESLYTKENFYQFTGQNKREKWSDIASLFDAYLKEGFKWREKSNWENKIINSNRSQFNMSFGYKISLEVPFDKLKKLDKDKSNLSNLESLLKGIYSAFDNDLIVKSS